MRLLGPLFTRLLDGVDLLFDAIASLWRVLLRGAFAPDAHSYRAAQFAPLNAQDILVQEIELNARDSREALKAVTLDADRLLPLAQDAVLFDVVGPIVGDGAPRARPGRIYVLGVVHKDALTRARAALPPLRRSSVEAFTHTPSAHPRLGLVFHDPAGQRWRRLRRTSIAAATSILAIAASDALHAGEIALTRHVAAAEAERVSTERRIRRAERSLSDARSAERALAEAPSPRLRDASLALGQIALHLPADAEVSSALLERHAMSISGRSYRADGAELALRRAFEGEAISFSSEPAETPQNFEAQLDLQTEPRR